MLDVSQLIQKNNLKQSIFQSSMGVEIESQRIDHQGRLSQLPYPEMLASRNTHPYLQTDFGETQTEWITDPLSDNAQILAQLTSISDTFLHAADDQDQIWLLSMPPVLNHEDRQFVREHFGRPKYQHYRDYLDGKFGIAHGLVTGVHINYSLPKPLLRAVAEAEHRDLVAVKNQMSWRVLQNFLKYRWLLTYFFGGSPVAEAGFFKDQPEELAHPVRSIRNSSVGFNNGGEINIPYVSLEDHVSRIKQAIDDGDLYAQMEFYGPVRIKGQSNLDDYLTKGIEYLEFRVFDTNPFSNLGIDHWTLDFMRALLTAFTTMPVESEQAEGDTIETVLDQAAKRNNKAALDNPVQPLNDLAAAQSFMGLLMERLTQLGAPTELLASVSHFQRQLDHPETTLSGRLVQQLQHGSLVPFMTKQASEHRQAFITGNDLLPNTPYDEPTQALLAAGICLGLQYQLEDDQIRFTHQHQSLTVAPFSSSFQDNRARLLALFDEQAVKLV